MTVGRILLVIRCVLGLETLDAGEALDERAVDAEVFAAQVLRDRFGDHGIEEGLGEPVRFQSFAVLGEGGVASKASSLGCRSRNQRKRRLRSICSQSWRSLRTE
jgi:hypothetical protein